MSSVLGLPFITGFTRPIYSPNLARIRITFVFDETVIQLNDEQYWLYAAVNPETNELLHTTLEPTRNTMIAQQFLAEIEEKMMFLRRCFSLMEPSRCKLPVAERATISNMKKMEIGMLLNVPSEK